MQVSVVLSIRKLNVFGRRHRYFRCLLCESVLRALVEGVPAAENKSVGDRLAQVKKRQGRSSVSDCAGGFHREAACEAQFCPGPSQNHVYYTRVYSRLYRTEPRRLPDLCNPHCWAEWDGAVSGSAALTAEAAPPRALGAGHKRISLLPTLACLPCSPWPAKCAPGASRDCAYMRTQPSPGESLLTSLSS